MILEKVKRNPHVFKYKDLQPKRTEFDIAKNGNGTLVGLKSVITKFKKVEDL